MYEIKYDNMFWMDLREVLQAIAEVSRSQRSVEKWAGKFIEAVESLSFMPYRSSMLPYRPSLYSVRVGKYKIFYSIVEIVKEVHVHRLVLGRRNLAGLFA